MSARAGLFGAGGIKQLGQTRLAPVGRVAMNNAALRRLINGRDKRRQFARIDLVAGPHLFVQSAKASQHAAVAKRPLRGLTRAFCC